MSKKVFILRCLPVIFFMGFIILLSTTTGDQAGGIFKLFTDPIRGIFYRSKSFSFIAAINPLKITHVIAYGVLGGLVYRAYHSNRQQKESRKGFGEPFLRPLLIVLGFAILDELVQHFIPGRSAQLSDVLLDTTAALLVMVVYKLIADNS